MTPTRGDARRTALLAAREERLAEGRALDEINIADLSRSAGVTRSAFYFYFENKAAAVAALHDEMYAEGFDAAGVLDGDGTVADRIESAIRAIVTGWSRRTHLYAAILDARAASPAVRDQWEDYQQSYVDVVADLIEAEGVTGAAPAGPDAREIALALLDLNDRTLERVVRTPDRLDAEAHLDAVVHVWLTSIYGSRHEAR